MSALASTRLLTRQLLQGRMQICLQRKLSVKPSKIVAASITHFRYLSDDAQPKQPKKDEKEPENSEKDENEPENSENVPDTGEGQTELNANIERLEKEVKDFKDKLMRSLAEQENTRRIAKRDVQNAKQFAIKSFSKALLDSSDNLERALEAVPEELRHDTENHPVLVTLYEGIQMTETGLNKALENNGLVKYGEIGEVFDPTKHEALYEFPDPDKEAGTIGQIMKSGFLLNNRVLRPAEVGVVKKG